MEVKIADLTWEPLIYPRAGKNEQTVEAYAEALMIGAQFPPIKIEAPRSPDGGICAALRQATGNHPPEGILSNF